MNMQMMEITKAPIAQADWEKEAKAWSERSPFFMTLHDKEERKAQVRYFTEYIADKHLLPSGGRACDIGCGVGDYAIGLAKEGANVTAIDVAPGMVEGARQLAIKEGVQLSLVVGPWSEETRQALGWHRTFDLTYSIFCPIMHDPAMLEALHKTSRKNCLFVAFADRRDEILDRLVQHYYGESGFDWQQQLHDSLEYIQTLGRNLLVSFQKSPETEAFTLADAVDYFALRLFDDGREHDLRIRQEIATLLAPFQQGEKIVNHTEDTIAWISWEVAHS